MLGFQDWIQSEGDSDGSDPFDEPDQRRRDHELSVSILDGYIYGFTLTELTLPFRKPGEVAEVAGNILEGFRNGEYPYLAEMAMDRAMKPGYDYGDEFEYGLDLILDGITRVNPAAPGVSFN
jgi:tetracycline repressor-like protein